MAHPLDRPVWSALTTGWAHLARGDTAALRLDPDYGPFAATAAPAALSALRGLIQGDEALWLVEEDAVEAPAGLNVESTACCAQMVAARVAAGEADFEIVALGEVDAAEMRALAHLTKPGPFASRTHELGQFIGVKQGGMLVAMAGERMRPTGFSEVSGVCTLPTHRGRGYAAGLMRVVMRRILARGETPFLHAYAANAVAIGLYRSLGFELRREMILTVLRAA